MGVGSKPAQRSDSVGTTPAPIMGIAPPAPMLVEPAETVEEDSAEESFGGGDLEACRELRELRELLLDLWSLFLEELLEEEEEEDRSLLELRLFLEESEEE